MIVTSCSLLLPFCSVCAHFLPTFCPRDLSQIKIAGADDPVFEAESEEQVRELVESFGEITDTSGLPVDAMLNAVAEYPKSHGFFAEVLTLMSSMPVDADSGLVKPADVSSHAIRRCLCDF